MSHRILAGLVAGIGVLAVAAPVQASTSHHHKKHHHKKHHHKRHHKAPATVKPGASYSGTEANGGQVTLTVASDGKSIEKGMTLTSVPVTCSDGSSQNFSPWKYDTAIPITGSSFAYSDEGAALKGTFGPNGTAKGTLTVNANIPGVGTCSSGPVDFSAKAS